MDFLRVSRFGLKRSYIQMHLFFKSDKKHNYQALCCGSGLGQSSWFHVNGGWGQGWGEIRDCHESICGFSSTVGTAISEGRSHGFGELVSLV